MLKFLLEEVADNLRNLHRSVAVENESWIVHDIDNPTVLLALSGRKISPVAFRAGSIPDGILHQARDKQRISPPTGYTSSRLLEWSRDTSNFIAEQLKRESKGMVEQIRRSDTAQSQEPQEYPSKLVTGFYHVNSDDHAYRYTVDVGGKMYYVDYFMNLTKILTNSGVIASSDYIVYEEKASVVVYYTYPASVQGDIKFYLPGHNHVSYWNRIERMTDHLTKHYGLHAEDIQYIEGTPRQPDLRPAIKMIS